MGLKDTNNPPPSAVTGCGKRRFDLGREMGVVVDEGDTVDLAPKLEAASDTTEPGQCLRCGLDLAARSKGGDKRSCGVACIVHARGG